MKFEEAVISQVTKKALKDIDLDAMAKKLKPQLEKAIETGAAEWMENNFYWDNVMEDDEIQDAIHTVIRAAILKGLGVEPKRTGK